MSVAYTKISKHGYTYYVLSFMADSINDKTHHTDLLRMADFATWQHGTTLLKSRKFTPELFEQTIDRTKFVPVVIMDDKILRYYMGFPVGVPIRFETYNIMDPLHSRPFVFWHDDVGGRIRLIQGNNFDTLIAQLIGAENITSIEPEDTNAQ